LKKITPAERLIVALDVGTGAEALKWVKRLRPAVSTFKVGLELFCTAGPSIVKKINTLGGKVFLDLKFFDIPNTMAGAVKSACESGAFLINVHALAGPAALKKTAQTVQQIKKPPLLIAVTILTSMDEAEMNIAGIRTPLPDRVEELCGTAIGSGLDGVVASPLETRRLREKFGKDFLIVTPGVRPEWAKTDDQKRISTPFNAIMDGADYIVVGRPILAAEEPLKAAEMIIKEIKEALKNG